MISEKQYEHALQRVEELLPMVNDDMPSDNETAMELSLMSDIVIAYEKEHFPMNKA